MKRLLAMLCAVSMVAALTACGSKEAAPETSAETAAEQNETEVKEASDSGEITKLTVGFDAEFPPYGYMDENGEYIGFDLDMAQEVCDRNGWELVKQPIDWDAKDMELSSGAIDCIWNGFTINGREDAYTWSKPYIDNSQMFVVAAESGIASKADLADKVVGVQKDSSALAALTDEENQENQDLAASFGNLVEYADYNTAFMDLEAGAIDALAIDIGVANYQISSRGDGYVMLQEPLSTEQYAIGFLLGNDTLKDAVEKTLTEMYEDGTVEKIAAEYKIDTTQICLGR